MMLASVLGMPEIVVIALIILILFGATKIPIFFKSLGKGVGEFKKGLKEGQEPEPKSKTAEETDEKPK